MGTSGPHQSCVLARLGVSVTDTALWSSGFQVAPHTGPGLSRMAHSRNEGGKGEAKQAVLAPPNLFHLEQPHVFLLIDWALPKTLFEKGVSNY